MWLSFSLPPFPSLLFIDRETRSRWCTGSAGSHEEKHEGSHIFAPRQSCVILARRHVAFQCIISTGKMPDMQNQIPGSGCPLRVCAVLSLPFSAGESSRLVFFVCPLSLSLFSPLSVFDPSPSIGSRGARLSCHLVAVVLAATMVSVYLWKQAASRHSRTVRRCIEHFFPSFYFSLSL